MPVHGLERLLEGLVVELRQEGVVLGLERFGRAHDRGSSHGQTRIIRKAYFEHADYVPLLRRAYQLWREMEIAAGEPLLIRTGGFAGLTPPPVEVDTAALPQKTAQHVELLVAGAKFFELPDTLKAVKPQPDCFQYSLKIVCADGRQHAIHCDEAAASEPLRELFYAVQNLKRK